MRCRRWVRKGIEKQDIDCRIGRQNNYYWAKEKGQGQEQGVNNYWAEEEKGRGTTRVMMMVSMRWLLRGVAIPCHGYRVQGGAFS